MPTRHGGIMSTAFLSTVGVALTLLGCMAFIISHQSTRQVISGFVQVSWHSCSRSIECPLSPVYWAVWGRPCMCLTQVHWIHDCGLEHTSAPQGPSHHLNNRPIMRWPLALTVLYNDRLHAAIPWLDVSCHFCFSLHNWPVKFCVLYFVSWRL